MEYYSIININVIWLFEWMKTIGIIGGTETSCTFCIDIDRRIKTACGEQPRLIMENVPMPQEIERRLITGEDCPQVFELLCTAVKSLARLEVDEIVIPCNSVHVFIEKLRGLTHIPIMSIIEETTKKCNKFRRIGLLATSTTLRGKLHEQELHENGIQVIVPEKQEIVNGAIEKILNNRATEKDKEELLLIIKRLQEMGAEAVILGCTDLGLLIRQEDVELPLIDTVEVLKDAVVKSLMER